MTEFNLVSKPIDRRALLRRAATEADTEHIITEPGVYLHQGRPAIIYGRLGARYDRMLWALKSIDYDKGTRTSGLKTRSRIFGFRPRVAQRFDFCSTASMALSSPQQHQIICEFGELLASIYREFAPQTFERHCNRLQEVRSEWVIPGTPFTSGIVNHDNPLKYHHDSGNFEDVFSCMVVFRKDCEGGYLSVPEFNSRFLLDDHTFFLFDGQAVLHGVTPIKKQTANSYRYSVVYYALKAMGACQSCEEELKRIRTVKRQREQRRLEPAKS